MPLEEEEEEKRGKKKDRQTGWIAWMETSSSFPAASSAALREIDSTTRRIYDFIDDVTVTVEVELEPVLVELYELGRLLQRKPSWDPGDEQVGPNNNHNAINRHEQQQQLLRPSLAWAVRSSADVCAQIRQILIHARDEKREHWYLGDAHVHVEALRMVLESIRRTVKVVFGALEDV